MIEWWIQATNKHNIKLIKEFLEYFGNVQSRINV